MPKRSRHFWFLISRPLYSFLSTVCVFSEIVCSSWSVTVLALPQLMWSCLVSFRWRCLTRTRMDDWIWMIWPGDDDVLVCYLGLSLCVIECLVTLWILLTGSWRWRRTSSWSLRWRRVDRAVAGSCGWCDGIMMGLCGAGPSDRGGGVLK